MSLKKWMGNFKEEIDDLNRKIRIYYSDYENIKKKVEALANFLQVEFVIEKEKFYGTIQTSPEPEKMVAVKKTTTLHDCRKCKNYYTPGYAQCPYYIFVPCLENDDRFEPIELKEVRDCKTCKYSSWNNPTRDYCSVKYCAHFGAWAPVEPVEALKCEECRHRGENSNRCVVYNVRERQNNPKKECFQPERRREERRKKS